MAKVAGQLIDVTASPSLVVSVWVRARRVRVHGGDVVTVEGAQVPITDGRVSFTCLPGPAVLTLERGGVPSEVVPLVVPDKPEASLEECIRAAELADTSTRSELEDLARRIVEGVSQAEQAAGTATGQAETATQQADVASGAAATAAEQAQVASGHADAAAVSEANAKTSEQEAKQAESGARDSEQTATEQAGVSTQAAQTATEQATVATEQAGVATDEAERATSEADRSKTEADRAASEAEASSVKAVAEKVDELLAGAPEAYDTLLEIAEELERGQSAEAALVKEISEKAPSDHTHTVGDVSGLQSALDGKAPASHTHTTSQISGLGTALNGKASVETVTSVSSRVTTLENSAPIIVSSLPSSPLPGRIYLVTE